ncbi:MAG: DUF7507 domain-containing protein, partial [bacterium]
MQIRTFFLVISLMMLGLIPPKVLLANGTITGTVTNCTQVTQAGETDADSTPNNLVGTNPVEDDESCVTVDILSFFDYGDAPDPAYATLLRNDGARHEQTDNAVYLGSCVDVEADGQQSSDTLGDDNGVGSSTIGTCTGNDDEDGVTFGTFQVGAENIDITVTANQSCRLNAWIDWNNNSSWGDVGDQIAQDLALNAGANTITLDVPATARAGATYARFRCSTAGGDGITGAAADGEVEDYRITIATSLPQITLKKYVQPAIGAPAYDNANEAATLGNDAQEFVSSTILDYNANALYRIRVENTGATYLGSVVVDDQITACDPLSKVYDSDGSTADGIMSIGEVWVMECTLPALKLDIVNTAKVEGVPTLPDGTPTGQSPVDDHDPANVRIRQAQPSIDIKKSVGAIAVGLAQKDAQTMADALTVDSGTTVDYQFVVTNNGNTPLANVVLTDHLDGCTLNPANGAMTAAFGDANNNGLLDLAETWLYTCSIANVTVDTYNLATVQADPVRDDGTPTGQSPVRDNDPANVKIREAQPNIALKKYVRPAGTTANSASELDAQSMLAPLLINSGDNVIYRFVVTNTGAAPLANVVLTDHLDGCTPSAATGDTDGDNLLDLTETWEYSCNVNAISVDTYNLATVQADPANEDGTLTGQSPVDDEDPANVRLISADPAIDLKKYVRVDGTAQAAEIDAQDAATALTVSAGSTVTYRLVITNTGSILLSNVVLTEHLAACTANVTWIDRGDNDPQDQLSPTETWVAECTGVQINTDTYNLATVRATPVNPDNTPTGQSPVDNEDPANVRVLSNDPSINLKKYVRLDGAAQATELDAQDAGSALIIEAGNNVTYRMVVTNNGQVLLDAVTLEDHLPSCNWTWTDRGDNDANNYLSPAESWVAECSSVNTTVDTYNLATVEAKPINDDGSSTGQSPVDDEDPANVRLQASRPAIALKKYVRPTGSAAAWNDAQDAATAEMITSGTAVDYQIRVTNTGNSPLANVQMEDHLSACNALLVDAGDNDANNILSPAEVWVYECSNVVTTVDTYNLATVEAQPSNSDGSVLLDQSPVDAEDPANVRLRRSQPAISLKKYVVDNGTDADAQDAMSAVIIDANSDVDYRLVVRNLGDVTLGNVQVTDHLQGCTLSAVSGDTNNNTRLETTETWEYTCTVSGVNTDLYNLATVEATPINDDGTPTGQAPVDDEDPANVKLRVQRPTIALKKYVVTAGGDRDAQDASSAVIIHSGDAVTYRLVVTNTGSAPLGNVVVDEALQNCTVGAPVITNNDGDNLLDTNEMWEYTCTINSVTDDLYNLATVTANPANEDGTLTDQSPVDSSDPANVRVRVNRPAIELKKYVVTAGGDEDAQDASSAVMINSGDTVNYRIVVTNTGTAPLAQVVVTEHLSNCPLSAASGDADNDNLLDTTEIWEYTCTQANVTVDTYNLATVEAKPANEDGTLTDQSPVDAEDPANVRLQIEQPAIELKKYVQPLDTAPAFSSATPLVNLGNDAQDNLNAVTIPSGGRVLYRIVVRNTGSALLGNVVVEDHLQGCNLARQYDGDSDANDTLATGEFWVYECTQADVINDIYNLATVEAQPLNADGTPSGQSPVDAEDPAHVRVAINRPAISLKKYVRPDGTAANSASELDAQDASSALIIDANSAVTYRLVVTNIGNAPLAEVQVEDHLPSCTLSAATGDTDGDNLLDITETWTYECSAVSLNVDTYNLATVTAKPANDDGSLTTQSPVSDEDPANVRMRVQRPAIALKKYIDRAGLQDAQDNSSAVIINSGENVNYRLVVTNAGNAPLADVTVTDHLEGCSLNWDSGDTDGDNLLDVNETWEYSCT